MTLTLALELLCFAGVLVFVFGLFYTSFGADRKESERQHLDPNKSVRITNRPWERRTPTGWGPRTPAGGGGP